MMPGTIVETYDSRAFSGGADSSIEFRFFIHGTDNPDDVYDLIRANCPETYRGVPRDRFNAEPAGYQCWRGSATYTQKAITPAEADVGQPPDPEERPPGEVNAGGNLPSSASATTPLGRQFSFSTAGGTTHISIALEHIKSHARMGQGGFAEVEKAPDHKGLIGVTKDGVEGCDIITPQTEFSYTTSLSNLTFGFFKRLIATTGKANKGDWGPFGDHEVLFMGADGQYKDGDTAPWSLSYRFGFSPTNEDVLQIGEIKIPAGEKKGWYYLWVEYFDTVDQQGNALLRQPRYAHIERVYDTENFNVLGVRL